jgi:hypothetical protein
MTPLLFFEIPCNIYVKSNQKESLIDILDKAYKIIENLNFPQNINPIKDIIFELFLSFPQDKFRVILELDSHTSKRKLMNLNKTLNIFNF